MGRRGRLGARTTGVVVLLLVGACGDGNGAAPGRTTSELAGRTFVVTSLDSADHDLVPGSQVVLAFSEGEVAVHAGCNHLSGQVSEDGERLLVTALGGTEMGCAPPLMAQDAWLSSFLTSGPRMSSSSASLTLSGGGTTMRLHEPQDDDLVMEGTPVGLDALVTGGGVDGAVSSLPAGARGPSFDAG